MAKYCGITSVDSLFDAAMDVPLERSLLHSASLQNDFVTARLFMRNMSAFIEHVLGVAPAHMKNKPFDGLFGKVKAYFGMIETQGGGNLHTHFLVWLLNVPPNSLAFELATRTLGVQLTRDIEAYTNSVATTSLPLDITKSTCLFCGHSYAGLEPLPIPDEAYNKVDRRSEDTRAEPLIVQCGKCKKKMSSQHVLRRVILDHYPNLWPPPVRDYTAKELSATISCEAQRRGCPISSAMQAVFCRDSFLSGREHDDSDPDTENLRAMNLKPHLRGRHQDDVFRDNKVARAVLSMPPSPEDSRWSPQYSQFAVSLLVFILNTHWWSHVGSCFKSDRPGHSASCRYGFPRGRIEQTVFTNEGVVMARPVCSEYVNAFNPILMGAFKSNHDIQVLIGGIDALLRIYYATKYVTKHQTLVESVTAVALAAFQRRKMRETADDSSASNRIGIGRKRVASLAFALTNRREIAGPLAALYLMRASCCYMSAACATLPLTDILKELVSNEAHTCNLVRVSEDDNVAMYRPVSLLDDYCCRPLTMTDLCLYEYVMKCFRNKRSSTTALSALFLPEHPLSTTHCVGIHQSEVVPVITGIRMPFVDADSPLEIVVRRSQCALLLFKPFRAVNDLVVNALSNESWVDAYKAWEPLRSSFILEIMANMDDYQLGNMQAKAEAATHNEDSGVQDDDDDITGTREDIDTMTERNTALTNDNSDSDDICALSDNFAIGEELPVFPTLNSKESAESAFVQPEMLTSSAMSTANSFLCLHQSDTRDELPNFTANEFKLWIENSSTDEAQPSAQFRNESPTQVIELLADALESAKMCWLPAENVHSQVHVGSYASVGVVSQAFLLNKRQHTAFMMIATALLRSFLRQEQDSLDQTDRFLTQNFQTQIREEQLLMFLGGAGGTGKSRVIDAVDSFCASWHRESAFVKTALTGKAATLIGARTLASFLLRIQRITQEKVFCPLDALVIDEVSMMSKPELLKLDKVLRRYRKIPDIPFGGVHVVLVGDFLQMPPVRGDPIFMDPREKVRPTVTDVEGFELWRMFTTVVVLEECMRFRSDPQWGEGCKKARLGEWTPEFQAIINSRVVENPGVQPSTSVFVTPENAKRLAINNAFIAETARHLPTGVYPLRVIANFSGALNDLSRTDLAYILGLPDNRFGRMAPYLDLINGMPVQITQNVGTPKGVANGTLGTLHSVHFPPETTFQLVRDGKTGMVVQLPSKAPEYALLRLPRSRAVPVRPGMDPELFPVLYKTSPFSKSTIPLPPAPNGKPRSLSIKVQQFPFVCAVGSTVYKIQGETLNAMTIVDWTSTHSVVNKPQQTYLLVSRVTSRHALIALSPFTPKLAKWSRPPGSALDEEQRLNQLSDRTLAMTSSAIDSSTN